MHVLLMMCSVEILPTSTCVLEKKEIDTKRLRLHPKDQRPPSLSSELIPCIPFYTGTAENKIKVVIFLRLCKTVHYSN